MTLQTLNYIVCTANDLPVTALASKSRAGVLPFCRMYFYYHAHKVYNFKSTEVAKFLNRDHTSVLSGCDTYLELMDVENEDLIRVSENVTQYKSNTDQNQDNEMKKVNLKLSWDEMEAIKSFIQDSIGKWPEALPKSYKWQWRLVQSVMAKWSLHLQQKLVFRKVKPFAITLDAPVACAFMLFFGWDEQHITTFLGITVHKIQNEIQKQLQ